MILKLIILLMIIVSAVGFGFVSGYQLEKTIIIKECNEFWVNESMPVYVDGDDNFILQLDS